MINSRIRASLDGFGTDWEVVYKSGREVYGGDYTFAFLWWWNWASRPPTFSLDAISSCCRVWRLRSLEKGNKRMRSRFREVPNKRRRWNLYFFHLINKDVMSFFLPNHCSMCVASLLWLYDDAYHIRVSSFTEHKILSYSLFGLRKVKLVLQVSWIEEQEEGLEKSWINLQWIKYGPHLSLNLAYICLLNIVHLSFNPSMLMAS